MKTAFLSLIFVIGISLNSKAQITLEASYDDASCNLYMINLEISGMKYVKVTRTQNNRFIFLYNLNHSLWKTINCNSFPVSYYVSPMPPFDTTWNYDFNVLYISENLFDLQPEVDFLFSIAGSSPWYTGIYNENSSLIFAADSVAPMVRSNVPQTFQPIYNTPNGTKMILSYKTGKAKVYGLQGILTNSIYNEFPTADQSFHIYPNPTSGVTTIEYSLPDNTDKGSIDIYDMTGALIRSYAIDNTFHN
ncbi:MAG: T9SS type A sorting domain-containing protein, partial [Bacteroidota bacterium]